MVPRTLSFAASLISAWLVLATPAQAEPLLPPRLVTSPLAAAGSN